MITTIIREGLICTNKNKLLLLAFICIAGNLSAQINVKASLQNMHLWRGGEVADGIVLTTDLSVSDRNKHFQFGFWGGVNANGSYKEFDNYLSYTNGPVKVALWDTYNFSTQATYNNEEFFNYNSRETGRFLDATISYSSTSKIPFLVSWSTIIFGRDRDGMNSKNRYSTFVYAEYSVWRNNEWEIKPGIGAAFALLYGKDIDGKSSKDHIYGNDFGIVHASLTSVYKLRIAQYDFPITALALWNPQCNKGYLQIGIQLISF